MDPHPTAEPRRPSTEEPLPAVAATGHRPPRDDTTRPDGETGTHASATGTASPDDEDDEYVPL